MGHIKIGTRILRVLLQSLSPGPGLLHITLFSSLNVPQCCVCLHTHFCDFYGTFVGEINESTLLDKERPTGIRLILIC